MKDPGDMSAVRFEYDEKENVLEFPASSPSVRLSRRQRLILLAAANADFLQHHIQTAMDTVPSVMSMPLVHVLKKATGGEVTKHELWKVIPYCLERLSDEQFDTAHGVAMQFLSEL